MHGSPINLRDFNHRTCLHVAVYSSDTETLKVIIQVSSFLGCFGGESAKGSELPVFFTSGTPLPLSLVAPASVSFPIQNSLL